MCQQISQFGNGGRAPCTDQAMPEQAQAPAHGWGSPKRKSLWILPKSVGMLDTEIRGASDTNSSNPEPLPRHYTGYVTQCTAIISAPGIGNQQLYRAGITKPQPALTQGAYTTHLSFSRECLSCAPTRKVEICETKWISPVPSAFSSMSLFTPAKRESLTLSNTVLSMGPGLGVRLPLSKFVQEVLPAPLVTSHVFHVFYPLGNVQVVRARVKAKFTKAKWISPSSPPLMPFIQGPSFRSHSTPRFDPDVVL
ncbi:hypothetical protein DFH06DRAFT_1148071 [Mycena polygramma]|nr:hypothetical protein DFH06DRAFT_1148071 [Mycena polygramma]